MKRDKNQKTEVSQFNPVPRYRAYGVTRKEHAFVELIKIWLLRLAAVLILIGPIMMIAIGLTAIMLYSPLLEKALTWAAIILFVLSAITKKVRNRLKFNRKLKRFCKKENFGLCFEKKFVESLKWSPDKRDLTIETPSRIYYLHVLHVGKARQKLLFESAQKISLITPPPRHKFSVIFDLKTKIKDFELDLSGDRSIGNKEAVSVILVLPGCLNMSYRKSNVSTLPTGNGGEHFGYTIFTAKGLMNFLPRYEDNLRKNNKI